MLALVLFAACASPPPSVRAVSPTHGVPGTDLVVTGDHFTADTVVRLGGKALAGARVHPPHRITGKVPEGLHPGKLDLVVIGTDGKSVSMPGAFTVDEPAPIDPCGGKEKRLTAIPPTADVVKIDRYLPDGTVDRQQIKVHEIEGVEYQVNPQGEGHTCACVWLRTRDDRRVLFDAQIDADLSQQAERIANGIHRPLRVVGDAVEATGGGG